MPLRVRVPLPMHSIPLITIILFAALLGSCPSTGDHGIRGVTGQPGGEPVPTPRPEPTPGLPFVITGGGFKWGECLGICRYGFTRTDNAARLTVSDYLGNNIVIDNRATITPVGRSRLEDVTAALETAQLVLVYGCPDCDDGGAAWLTAEIDGIPTTIEWEYANPPAVLAEVDALLDLWIASMTDCLQFSELEHDPGCAPLN